MTEHTEIEGWNGTRGRLSLTHNSWEVSSVYAPNGDLIAECHIDPSVTEETQDALEPVKEANARLLAASKRLALFAQRVANTTLFPESDTKAHEAAATFCDLKREARALLAEIVGPAKETDYG